MTEIFIDRNGVCMKKKILLLGLLGTLVLEYGFSQSDWIRQSPEMLKDTILGDGKLYNRKNGDIMPQILTFADENTWAYQFIFSDTDTRILFFDITPINTTSRPDISLLPVSVCKGTFIAGGKAYDVYVYISVFKIYNSLLVNVRFVSNDAEILIFIVPMV
jgi:hypothetical protein